MRFARQLALTALASCAFVRHAAAQVPEVKTVVAGVVFDSLAMKPLADAAVQLVGSTPGSPVQNARTDSLGRFRFADVPAGTYFLGFFHYKLDSLALEPQTLRVDIRNTTPVNARLAIRSPQSIARAVCGPTAVKDSTGLLMAYLRGADNALPRKNGSLRVRWSEIVIERGSVRQVVPAFDATSGPSGLITACGVPLGAPILLQASSESDSSGAFEVTLPASGFLHRNIYVAPFTHSTTPATDSTPAIDLIRGSAKLRGKVIGATGRPIPGARVTLWGTGVEATTNQNGEFFLDGLPGGTHTVDVRAVGFNPVQRPVDVVQTNAGATEIELANLGFTLDTVRVTARLYSSKREAEFERRRRMGLGHVFTEEDIAKRNPMFVSDLLRLTPGVRIVPSRFSGQDVLMRGNLGDACRPEIFVDGVRMFNDPAFPVDNLVPAIDLRAVEVYPRSIGVPAEFSSMNQCGVVAIWTGPRRVAR